MLATPLLMLVAAAAAVAVDVVVVVIVWDVMVTLSIATSLGSGGGSISSSLSKLATAAVTAEIAVLTVAMLLLMLAGGPTKAVILPLSVTDIGSIGSTGSIGEIEVSVWGVPSTLLLIDEPLLSSSELTTLDEISDWLGTTEVAATGSEFFGDRSATLIETDV